MKRSRFAEEQIIAVLREQEAGVATVEVCRKAGKPLREDFMRFAWINHILVAGAQQLVPAAAGAAPAKAY